MVAFSIERKIRAGSADRPRTREIRQTAASDLAMLRRQATEEAEIARDRTATIEAQSWDGAMLRRLDALVNLYPHTILFWHKKILTSNKQNRYFYPKKKKQSFKGKLT